MGRGGHSAVRQGGAASAARIRVPIDRLGFRVSRRSNGRARVFGQANYGQALIGSAGIGERFRCRRAAAVTVNRDL